MNSITQSRARSDVEQRYGKESLTTRIYNRFRTSFLLKFMLIGVGLVLLGLYLAYGRGMNTWGSLLGASGFIFIVVNFIFYLGYLWIDRQF